MHCQAFLKKGPNIVFRGGTLIYATNIETELEYEVEEKITLNTNNRDFLKR